jgi:hypothetical protein
MREVEEWKEGEQRYAEGADGHCVPVLRDGALQPYRNCGTCWCLSAVNGRLQFLAQRRPSQLVDLVALRVFEAGVGPSPAPSRAICIRGKEASRLCHVLQETRQLHSKGKRHGFDFDFADGFVS